MPDNIAGSLIGAGGSVAGGLIGGIFGNKAQRSANRTNLQIARETNAQNYQIFKEQQEYNEHMYNQWLDYNSPINQRARYEQAGINPYMAMSNIGSGSPQSALQSPQAPQMQGAQVQPVDALSNNMSSAIQQAAQVYATVSTAQAQNEKTKAETAAIVAQQPWISRLNSAKEDNLRSYAENQSFDYTFKMNTLGNMTKLSDLSVAQGNVLLAQMNNEVNRQVFENALLSIDLKIADKYKERQVQQSIAQTVAQIAQTYASISQGERLTQAQCNELATRAAKQVAETTNIKLDNYVQDKIKDLVVKVYSNDTKISNDDVIHSARERKDYNANWWNRIISGYIPFASGIGSSYARGHAAKLFK